MDNEKALAILLLISTFGTEVKHYETSRKFDKFRKQTRLKINRFIHGNEALYKKSLKTADDAFEYAKKKTNNNKISITLSTSMLALYTLLDDHPYQTLLYTEKTFHRALNSISHGWSNKDGEQAAEGIVDMFRESLGLKEKRSLYVLRRKIENNKILEG